VKTCSKNGCRTVGFFDLFEKHANTLVMREHAPSCPDESPTNKHALDRPDRGTGKRVRRIAHLTIDMLRKASLLPSSGMKSAFAFALDDIVDYMRRGHRIILYEVRELPDDMENICLVLQQAVKEFRTGDCLRFLKTRKEQLQEPFLEINRLETKATVSRNGIAMLFHNRPSP
jgi:hypothetical protein